MSNPAHAGILLLRGTNGLFKGTLGNFWRTSVLNMQWALQEPEGSLPTGLAGEPGRGAAPWAGLVCVSLGSSKKTETLPKIRVTGSFFCIICTCCYLLPLHHLSDVEGDPLSQGRRWFPEQVPASRKVLMGTVVEHEVSDRQLLQGTSDSWYVIFCTMVPDLRRICTLYFCSVLAKGF